MKKRVPLSVAALTVAVAVAICGYVYTKIPTTPPPAAPPPAGKAQPRLLGRLRSEKREAMKEQAAAKEKAAHAGKKQDDVGAKKSN